MSKLKILDGRFCRDGVFELPEFGNREQIEVLKKNNALLRAYREGMVVVEPDTEEVDDWCDVCDEDHDDCFCFEHSIRMDCPCGRVASAVSDHTCEDDPADALGEWADINCLCGRKYEANLVYGTSQYQIKILE